MSAIPKRGATDLTALIFIAKRYRLRLWTLLWISQYVPSAKLMALDFVHVATWNRVRQPGSDWDGYLLFVSNFSGDTTEYLSNFADILTGAIVRAFGYGQGFPGATPSPAFVNYVADKSAASSVYYTAYGDSSTRDIGAAFKVQRTVTALQARALMDPPDDFAAAYEKQMDQVQTRDPTPMTGPEHLKLIYQALWQPNRMGSLTVMFRVKPGCEGALCSALDAMGTEVAIPNPTVFDIVLGTHFARFVPLALPNTGDPGGAPKYLVFSAQIDGTCPEYIERLRVAIASRAIGGDGMESVLECCVGYPRTDKKLFREWFEFYTTPVPLIIAEEPLADRGLMLSTLAVARHFQDFGYRHQGCPPSTLLADFRQEFPTP